MALAAAVVVMATVVFLAITATRASAANAAGAGAILSLTPDGSIGAVFAAAAVADNGASASASSRRSPIRYDQGLATVSSCLVGTALLSESDVSLSDVTLLDGTVTVKTITVVAQASASASGAHADGDGSYVSGLAVDGKPVDDSVGSVAIEGVGTLTVLATTTDEASPRPTVTVTALRLELDHPVGDLPAGSVLTVGRATAVADREIAEQLMTQEKAASGPSPLPAPLPSSTGKPDGKTGAATGPQSGAGKGSESGSVGKGGASANGSAAARHASARGGGGAAAGNVVDSTMPPPAPPRKELLARFPGAVFPVKGPVDYSDSFGAYRADLKGHRHQGVDIFAVMGTPLVAVVDGTIEYSRQGIGGNNAHLTDAAGDYFYYAHMVRFARGLTSGDTVKRGEVIGYVGETGDAAGTSPHLHFEIHPDGGVAVDPYPYLEAWRAAAAGIHVADAAQAPVAHVPVAIAGLPAATILARRGVVPGLDLGTLTIVTFTHRVIHGKDLPAPGALETLLFLASLGGISAIRRLRVPELPEILAADETVVRQTVRVAERPLTNS